MGAGAAAGRATGAGGTLIDQGTLMRQMIFTTILVHDQ